MYLSWACQTNVGEVRRKLWLWTGRADTQPQTELALRSCSSDEWSQESTFQMTRIYVWVWAPFVNPVEDNYNWKLKYLETQTLLVRRTFICCRFHPKQSTFHQKQTSWNLIRRMIERQLLAVLFSSYPAEQHWYQRPQMEMFSCSLIRRYFSSIIKSQLKESVYF